MQFYIYEEFEDFASVYSALVPKDFELIKNGGFKSFPERFFRYKNVNLMFSLDYAMKYARDSRNFPPKTIETHLIKFFVPLKKLNTFREPGSPISCIPTERLFEFNRSIVGYIERWEKITL